MFGAVSKCDGLNTIRLTAAAEHRLLRGRGLRGRSQNAARMRISNFGKFYLHYRMKSVPAPPGQPHLAGAV
jgi:hypothetical protein